MFTFFALLILFKSIEIGIIYIGQWRGGGKGLMLVEVEVFSGVGGGGRVILFREIEFFMGALIIS